MKTYLSAFFYVLFLCFVFVQCDETTPVVDNEEEPIEEPIEQDTLYNIVGQAQKGPFISGSSVTVYGLKRDFSPTGKSFNTQITDNKGSFELRNLSLSSRYANLRADGFYYNEVTGQQSVSQITLNAITELGGEDVCVNLLTHLEKARVEYLISEGTNYVDAKQQAQGEVLAIFNIATSDLEMSERLSIENDGALLAVSAILQGFRSESEMTELLSNISLDLREDGVLDSETIGSTLINHAILLDTVAIKEYLCDRYEELGVTITCPSFGVHIANFITTTDFEITESPISYPEIGLYGDNVLNLNDTVFDYGFNINYSLAAELAEGASLNIRITSLTADSTYIHATDSTEAKMEVLHQNIWYYSLGSQVNYIVGDFDYNDNTQTFTAVEPNKACDISLRFNKGKYLVEYYERDMIKPSRTKTITFVQ